MSRRTSFTPSRTRLSLLAVLALALLVSACGNNTTESGRPSSITLDWAYYNPVSLVLKDNDWLEEALGGDISVSWVHSAGSNRAIELLNSNSVQFGSTAGAAALLAKINGSPINSIYVYSQPEWTALVTREDSGITSVADLAGKRVAVNLGTDPYIFLVRALSDNGLSLSDVETVLLQHADGRNALIARQVDVWAGLDPMMAEAELEQEAVLFYRRPELNTWGVLNVHEDFARDHPDVVRTVIEVYERGRQWAIDNPDELAKILADAAGLTVEVAETQLERTSFATAKLGDPQYDSILGAGIALQQSGVIEDTVDVEAIVNALFDRSFTAELAD